MSVSNRNMLPPQFMFHHHFSFSKDNLIIASHDDLPKIIPPVEGDFLLSNNSNFLLSDGTNFLLS